MTEQPGQDTPDPDPAEEMTRQLVEDVRRLEESN
jgi:hypothetical protein